MWEGIEGKTDEIGGSLGMMWKSSDMKAKMKIKVERILEIFLSRQSTFRYFENLLNI